MRVFVNKPFDRWSRREDVDDDTLCRTIEEIGQGLWEANLGGSLFKKRVARKGQGKSGGYRTVVAFKARDRAIFLYGFAKNDKGNIDNKEEKALKKLAKTYFGFGPKELQVALKAKELRELVCANETQG